MLHLMKGLYSHQFKQNICKDRQKIPIFYTVLPYCFYYKSISATPMLEARIIDDTQ